MSAFEARMQELAAQFRTRAAHERQRIATALEQQDRETLRSASHGLAGIATIFGHSDIGAAAADVEDALDVDAAAPELRRVSLVLVERLDRIA